MKRKELIQLGVAGIIFIVAGYIIFLQVAPKKGPQSEGIKVDVVTPINPEFDQNSLDKLTDSSQVVDYYTPPNLDSGLGNSQPFGR